MLLPLSFLQENLSPIWPRLLLIKWEKLLTSRIKIIGFLLLTLRTQLDKGLNYIKELLKMDSSSSVERLWSKDPQLRRNSFGISNPINQLIFQFTLVLPISKLVNLKSNSWSMNLHLDSLWLMVRVPFMPHFKAMLETLLIHSLSSCLKSIIREVSLQSVLLVYEQRKGIII